MCAENPAHKLEKFRPPVLCRRAFLRLSGEEIQGDVQATAVTVPSGGLPEELLARGNFFTAHTYAGRWNSLLGGPSAFSKRGRFHCQAKIKVIFVSSSIFDSNDAESVEKSHPPFRLVMRVALIVFQIYGLQEQGSRRRGRGCGFFHSF